MPSLIGLEDIRGDLHSHTVASDGHNTIEEMAGAARERGYEYLAITDHSATHGFGNDVSAEQLRRQIELVREADAAIDGIELLAGSEVNILPDGSLDYEDELLGELDWVIASVHTAFGMSEQAMTERMIAAIEHPLVDAIGHPTGRLIERRAPYAIDLEAVFAAAARTGTMLEINANPDRRDLSDVHARAAAPRRRDDRDRLRRPPHRHAREHALGRGHRAPRVAAHARTSPTRGRGRSCRSYASRRGSSSSATSRSTASRRERERAPPARARRSRPGDRPGRVRSALARSSPTRRGSSARAIGSAA